MSKQATQTVPVGAAASVTAVLECMRPAQWIKNLFVLSPLLFSFSLHNPVALKQALLIFAAFCASASGVYLWNDSLDWRADLVHPEKRGRPIPSGRLSPAIAMVFGSLLLTSGLGIAFSLNFATGIILSVYALMNVAYTLWLKNVVIMDVMCIALGFVLRVMAGAEAISVRASHWLLLCTFLLALFLGIAKRRHEIRTLAQDSGRHRPVLQTYTLEWLDQAGTLVAAAAIMAYALYSVAPETQARFGSDRLIYTLPLVVFGVLRYLHMMHSSTGQTGNPSTAILADKPLVACLVGWALACAAILYA